MSTIADDAQPLQYPRFIERSHSATGLGLPHSLTTMRSTPASGASVLTAEDRRRVLGEWSTGVELSELPGVAGLIRRARSVPGLRTAIRFGSENLTYGELFGRLDGAVADRASAPAPVDQLVRLMAALDDAADRGVVADAEPEILWLPRPALAAAVADRRAVAAECRYVPVDPALGSADVRLLATGCGDAQVAVELLAALADGATLVIATESQRAKPAALVELIVTRSVTHVVAAADTVVRIADVAASLPTIRRWDIIGTDSAQTLPGRLVAVSPESVATNAYTTPAYAGSVARGPLDGTGRTRPIPGARVLVLDESRLPVAPGVLGEVYVGGAALGTDDGDVTVADRFVTDPFLPDARLFRTGDRAGWTTDGWLVFATS